jgi:uncharacterized protein YutE (UPF0331/DUF86 family)
MIFITVLVGSTILLANLAISFEGMRLVRSNVVIINVGQSAFITSLFAIAYFVFDVIYPGRIEAASKKLQDQLDPSRSDQTKGGLEEFLKNYNRIESWLEEAGKPYQDIPVHTISYEKRSARRLSNTRLAEILLRNERINKDLFDRLRELITLRNSIIHGAEPVVSQKFIQMSEEVLQELEIALMKASGDKP